MLLIPATRSKATRCFRMFASDSTDSLSETSVQQVQDSSDVIKDGRVRVVFSVPHEPQLDTLIQNQHVSQTVALALQCFSLHFQKVLTRLRKSLFVEVLREVQSRIRPGLSPGRHQLPRVPLLREHFHRPRLEEEVSVQLPCRNLDQQIQFKFRKFRKLNSCVLTTTLFVQPKYCTKLYYDCITFLHPLQDVQQGDEGSTNPDFFNK